MSEAPDLAAAWQRVAPTMTDLRPDERAPVSQELLMGFEGDLKSVFAKHFAQREVDRRFALPDDYRRFIVEIGGDWRHADALLIFDLRAVLSDTESACDLFADMHGTGRSLWLTIGRLSDKQDVLLCCDRESSEFGQVMDGHDDHPWLNGSACTILGESFTGWLISLAERAEAADEPSPADPAPEG